MYTPLIVMARDRCADRGLVACAMAWRYGRRRALVVPVLAVAGSIVSVVRASGLGGHGPACAGGLCHGFCRAGGGGGAGRAGCGPAERPVVRAVGLARRGQGGYQTGMAPLPTPRGTLTPNRPLADLTWLRVGGPADWLFQPADEADLAEFLAALAPEVAVFPMGVGSNLIVRDGGIRAVVIRLGRGFNGDLHRG